MRYIMQNMNDTRLVAIHESHKLRDVGDITAAIPESERPMWQVVAPAASDFFDEQLHSLVNEEMCDFQVATDIDDGGLPPELEAELESRISALKDIVATCKAWQLANK